MIITGSTKTELFSRNNVNDPVQVFCKANGIDCQWDFNQKTGTWNEIMYNDKLLMQIDQGITLDQFKNVFRILNQDFYATEFPDDGIEFQFNMRQDEETKIEFRNFMTEFGHLFK